MIQGFDIDQLKQDPWDQFDIWYKDALACNEISYPHAFTLSTLSADGYPEGRVVLMKEKLDSSIVFYTNFLSNKGKSLLAYPRAGASFYWDPLGRQVRMYGSVVPVEGEDADLYFASRSRNSQIGAWASSQSEEISSREDLYEKVRSYEKRFEGGEIPRPPHWSGFILCPLKIEFWQFGESRLHDRFQYALTRDGVWKVSRLQP